MNLKSIQRNSVKYLLSIVTVLALLASSCSQNSKHDTQHANKDSTYRLDHDLDEIDQVVKNAYAIWHHSSEKPVDFSNYSEYFTSTAQFQEMIKDSVKVTPLAMNVIEFEEAIAAQYFTYFDEREIASESKVIGNMAHRVSYHEYYVNQSDTVSFRAVNSVQLVKQNNKWKVQSLLRQDESEDFPFPEEISKRH